MDHTLTKLPKSEIQIEVSLSFSEFEPFITKAVSKISEEGTFEGFRKGKAPLEVVKARIGEALIYEQAAELAIRKTYPDILAKALQESRKEEKEDDFIPIGQPEVTVTKLAPKNEFCYKVKLALLPEVFLPDFREIARRVRATKKDVSVEDREVENTLEWLRESRVLLLTVERPAERGDRVEIDFEVRSGDVKIAGGDSKNHPVVIGQGKFIPGFEDKLIGMRKGEEKEFTLQVPPEWHEKSLAGKVIECRVSVKLVQVRNIPDLSDEFAKAIGNFSSLDSLRSSIREGIRREKEAKETERARMAMIEEIAAHSKFETPDVLITSELQKMVEELKSGIAGMGMKWEDYLLHVKKTEEALRSEWSKEAERRVRVGLVLRKIVKRENIEVSQEEVEARYNEELRQFQAQKEAGKKIDPESLREYTKGVLKNEKVFEFLEKI